MIDEPPRRGGLAELAPAPAVILVRPQMGENIGATARAMLNFGLAELRLVAPRDGWPNPAAEAMASGAVAVLEGAKVFATVEDALADIQFALATTARPREMRLPVVSPEIAAADMAVRTDQAQRCAFLFGAERSGLENDEILKSDGIISIPVNPAFASLNLAQAVLVVGYEWSRHHAAQSKNIDDATPAPAPKSDFQNLMAQLFSELDDAGYFFPPEKRTVKERNLTVALARAGLTEGEVRTWRGVIKALASKGRNNERAR